MLTILAVTALGFDHEKYVERLPTHRLVHLRLGRTSPGRLEGLPELASQDGSYEARLVTLQGGD